MYKTPSDGQQIHEEKSGPERSVKAPAAQLPTETADRVGGSERDVQERSGSDGAHQTIHRGGQKKGNTEGVGKIITGPPRKYKLMVYNTGSISKCHEDGASPRHLKIKTATAGEKKRAEKEGWCRGR